MRDWRHWKLRYLQPQLTTDSARLVVLGNVGMTGFETWRFHYHELRWISVCCPKYWSLNFALSLSTPFVGLWAPDSAVLTSALLRALLGLGTTFGDQYLAGAQGPNGCPETRHGRWRGVRTGLDLFSVAVLNSETLRVAVLKLLELLNGRMSRNHMNTLVITMTR